MEHSITNNIKKIFCIVLALVLLSSNIKVFSQELQATKPISSSEMAELEKEFTEVREMLLSFREYFNKKVSGFKIKREPYFNGYLLWDNIGFAQEKITKLDEAYISLLDKTYSYADYILDEEGNTALKRLTYKYLDTPGITVKNYHLEEGVMLEKIQSVLDRLERTWFEAPSFEKIITSAQTEESVINDLINALDTRLSEVRRVFQRSVSRNNEIYIDNTIEIIEKHITVNDVLNYVLRTIPEEDRKAIGLLIKKNNLKASKLELAAGIRKYLIIKGYKNVPSVFKLLKAGVLETWETKEFEKIVNSKYKKLIEDFSVIRNGRYVSPKYTMRRIMRSTPLMVLAAALTVGAISEIRSDNNFTKGTRGARKMKELAEKVKNGDASFMESVVYYSDNRSSSVVNKDAVLLIDAISLSLALKQANRDFDIIVKKVEEGIGSGYTKLVGEEIENSLNMFYDEALKQAEGNII